jgi:hypothetical protein
MNQAADTSEGDLDSGLIAGRFLQILAGISVASMLLGLLLGNVYFDCSFLFLFWAGAALIKRSRVARAITIFVSAGICLVGVAMTAFVSLRGTNGVIISVGPWQESDPTIGMTIVTLLLMITLAATPLYLLLTPTANQQFAAAKLVNRDGP